MTEKIECSACGGLLIIEADGFQHCRNFCFSGGIDITKPKEARRFLDWEVSRIFQLESLLVEGLELRRKL